MKHVMKKQEWFVLELRELMKTIWGGRTGWNVDPGVPCWTSLMNFYPFQEDAPPRHPRAAHPLFIGSIQMSHSLKKKKTWNLP